MIIDGKKISEEILEEVRLEVQSIKEKHGTVPGLAVIIVGDDPASKIYVNNKKRACSRVGVYSREYSLPEDTTQERLLNLIDELNLEKKIKKY